MRYQVVVGGKGSLTTALGRLTFTCRPNPSNKATHTHTQIRDKGTSRISILILADLLAQRSSRCLPVSVIQYLLLTEIPVRQG